MSEKCNSMRFENAVLVIQVVVVPAKNDKERETCVEPWSSLLFLYHAACYFSPVNIPLGGVLQLTRA